MPWEYLFFSLWQTVMTAKLNTIAIINNYMVCIPTRSNLIVDVRFCRVEIHNKQKVTLFKDNHFVFFVRQSDELVSCSHCLILLFNLVHVLVKSVELAESERLIFRQTPLSPTVVVTKVVFRPWEINPFWVTEFVPHEIEVSLTAKTLCKKSNHFMKSNTPVYSKWNAIPCHSSVNIFIEEPLGDSLITYNCLVMRFSVSDALFFPSSISETVSEVTHIPIFIC